MLDDYPVTVTQTVRWGEMDALGHVNNTVFFRWFEDVRIATFARIGIDSDGSGGIGPILATTQCDFLAPVTYPATVRSGCRIPRIGRTSFTMEYAVVDADSGNRVARGSGVIVMVDYAAGGKVPVPDAVRAAIEAL